MVEGEEQDEQGEEEDQQDQHSAETVHAVLSGDGGAGTHRKLTKDIERKSFVVFF